MSRVTEYCIMVVLEEACLVSNTYLTLVFDE